MAAPSLVTLTRRAYLGECRLPKGSALVLAVSGGPDSMALLDVSARLVDEHGLRLFAHGVDHGLRAEASGELDLAEAHARRLAIPFTRTRLAVVDGGNLQARARSARYAALRSAAHRHGASAIATAHHADDRAETFLLRLLRGSGPRGLAVLPPRARLQGEEVLELIRPLLRARRDDIRAHLSRHAIAHALDRSNEDPRFQRVRVRRELLPLLEELGPGIVRHIEALTDQLEVDRNGQPPSMFPLPRATEEALRKLVHERSRSARIWLPGGLVAQVAATDGTPEVTAPAPVPAENPCSNRSFSEERGPSPPRRRTDDP